MNFTSLRLSPSGPPIEGENQDDTLLWDATEKKWFTGPGGAAAEDKPFTLVVYVDVGRTDSTESGSDEQPFITIQAAVDYLATKEEGPGTVIITDGDYSAEDITINHSVALVAPGNLVQPGQINFNSGSFLVLENVLVGTLNATADVLMRQGGAGSVNCVGTAHLRAQNAAFGDLVNVGYAGRLTLTNCTMNEVNTGTLAATDCVINQDAVTGSATLHSCTWNGTTWQTNALIAKESDFAGAVTSTGTTVDAYSLDSLRTSGAANSLGTVTISDNLWTQAAFTVPALTATFADVTLSSLGGFNVAPGDTFSYAPVATHNLAGVALVAMWSPVAGSITGRFFGTTAGGAYSCAIHRNVGSTPT